MWINDITYVLTNEGWFYLADVKDLYAKDLVGYTISEGIAADLPCKALSMAVNPPPKKQRLILYSVRVGQYYSHALP